MARVKLPADAGGYRSGTEVLTNRIREAIVSGELNAQEPLTQSSLAERFEVSRTPLREDRKSVV